MDISNESGKPFFDRSEKKEREAEACRWEREGGPKLSESWVEVSAGLEDNVEWMVQDE